MHRLQKLRENIARVYMGHPEAIDRVIVCLVARGHVLIEDVPGVGKTTLAQALARSVDCNFSRLQMTPDLLPADVLGVSVWSAKDEQFHFKPGPVFSHILLADEINRTTPRTQSALLEAMSECQVSVDGQTRPIDPPFMVVATQNPFEFEGTYFLPESQLDRFLMRFGLGYPNPADEGRVLREQPATTALHDLTPVMSRQDVLDLQGMLGKIRIDDSLIDYVVQLATATREHEAFRVGVSPRGTLALTGAARATAMLAGRDFVVPDDILANFVPVCAHRVVTKAFSHNGHADAAAEVLNRITETVASP